MSNITTLSSLVAPLAVEVAKSVGNKLGSGPKRASSKKEKKMSKETKALLSSINSRMRPSRNRNGGRGKGRSSRGGRQGGRSGPGRGADLPPRQSLSGPPVSVGSSFGSQGGQSRYYKRTTSRNGTECASIDFSTFLAAVYTDGVVLANDYQIPFSVASTAIAGIGSGFINALGGQVSALLMHPTYFGSRMNRETNNWTKYHWEWIRVTYVGSCPTSTPGALLLALGDDPASFFEASGTQAAPTISFANLSQQSPFRVGPLYSTFSVGMKNDEVALLPCELNQSGIANNIQTYAYNRTSMFGRLGGLLSNVSTGAPIQYGEVWIEGLITFHEPSASTLSIGTTNTHTALAVHSDNIYNLFSHQFYDSVDHYREVSSDCFPSDSKDLPDLNGLTEFYKKHHLNTSLNKTEEKCNSSNPPIHNWEEDDGTDKDLSIKDRKSVV